jgi:hypothetical protein
MNYLDVIAPTVHRLNAIVSVWRLLQFLGPSLCIAYPNLWSDSESISSILGIISVLWHFQPPPHFTNNGCYFNIIITVLITSALLLCIGSSIYVQKYATLPRALPVILTVWQNSFGFVLLPPAIAGKPPDNSAILIVSSILITL